ncbi:hypothetical protein [Brevundimonas aurantiaca]|uniref:hypothetical protein n=1 Tax=Brevundimonas aurantiaca TaxID=74316 RepID=UPI00174C04A1|nr:hypothetical protein [Brevundimonas aurantiaca]
MRTDTLAPLSRRTVLAVLSGGLAGCFQRDRVPSGDELGMRFRLTLEVFVDGRPVRGSSIRQFKYFNDPGWFPSDGAGQSSWQGDATPLALPGAAYLFAMLEGYVIVRGLRERSHGPWTPYDVVLSRLGKRAVTQSDYEALSAAERQNVVSPAQARALVGTQPIVLALGRTADPRPVQDAPRAGQRIDPPARGTAEANPQSDLGAMHGPSHRRPARRRSG